MNTHPTIIVATGGKKKGEWVALSILSAGLPDRSSAIKAGPGLVPDPSPYLYIGLV